MAWALQLRPLAPLSPLSGEFMITKIAQRLRLFTILVLAATAASSQATVYSSQAAFLAANPGLTLQDFEGICSSGTCPVPAFTGFSVTGPNPVIADGPTFGAPSDWLADNTFNGFLTLHFAPNINAVGFNLSAGFSGGNLVVNVLNGVNLLDSELVSTVPLSSFTSF